jgi:hypothetical protein
MDAEAYQLQLREIKTNRLYALKLKEATFGRNLPAEDLVEIAGLQKELGMTELAISSPISAGFADELGPAGQFQVLTQQNEIARKRENERDEIFNKRFGDAIAYLGDRITAVEVNAEEWRHSERMARTAGQTTNRTIFLIVGGILFLVVLSLIALAIVVTSRFAGQIL